jgi:hypothetical protein
MIQRSKFNMHDTAEMKAIKAKWTVPDSY